MSVTTTFLCGFAGSLAIEVAALHQVYQAWTSTTTSLPDRYKKVGFWVTRFCLALAAGGLAVAYEIEKPILAVNIGASAPIILNALGQGFRNSAIPPGP
jgi:hypothetical protein